MGRSRVFSNDLSIHTTKFPWVKCFVCPTHGMDGFLKDVGSSVESIRIQVKVMGISGISNNVLGISE
jgi:hypothetical protein